MTREAPKLCYPPLCPHRLAMSLMSHALLPGRCAMPIISVFDHLPALPLPQSTSRCPSSILLLQERTLYPHYLWVLWHDLPFAVASDASLCLGHHLLKFINAPTLTPKTMANGSLSTSQASPLLIQDITTKIKYPQKPLICACMLPIDYCLSWFWVLALLQSECVAGHESHRGNDIQMLAILTCVLFFFSPRRQVFTMWAMLTPFS